MQPSTTRCRGRFRWSTERRSFYPGIAVTGRLRLGGPSVTPPLLFKGPIALNRSSRLSSTSTGSRKFAPPDRDRMARRPIPGCSYVSAARAAHPSRLELLAFLRLRSFHASRRLVYPFNLASLPPPTPGPDCRNVPPRVSARRCCIRPSVSSEFASGACVCENRGAPCLCSSWWCSLCIFAHKKLRNARRVQTMLSAEP